LFGYLLAVLERRNHLRRAVCGGLVVGALAGLLVGILEIAALFATARPSLSLAGGPLRFGPPLLGLAMGAGAILGLFEGLVVAAVLPLSEWLAGRRIAQPRWAAMLYTAILIPAVAWLCAVTFSGRKAREIRLHDVWVVATGAVLITTLYLGFRALQRLRERLAGTRAMLPAALACAVLAAVLLVVDRVLLVRLYGFFHVTLELLAFAALEIAVLAASMGLKAGQRRWAVLAAPRGAFAVALLGITGAAFGLARFRAADSQALRIVAHDHGAVSGRLLDLARACGLPAIVSPASAAYAPPRAPSDDAGGPRLPGADIILITVDALRADHLGAYGYGRPTSPRLDALAKESIVFERAYAAVPHTSFSIASLMTGKYAWSLAALGMFDVAHETIADALRNYGYATAGFFPPAVFYVDGDRFKRLEERRYGFDHVRYEPFHEDIDAPRRTDQVIAWLDREKPGHAIVWVHYFGPHEPYVPHPENGAPFGDRAVDRYDGEIRWVDAEVGRLVDHVRKTRPLAVIAVTADHGEEFGEHGGAYHGTTLYDEQLRVPLLVHAPGVPARRVRAPVSTVDVLPTLLGLVDVPPSTRVRGTDLTPWMKDAVETGLPPVFAEIDSLKMVTQGTEKLICDAARGFCRLYDLAADPGETKDLSAARKERVQALQGLLAGWMESHGEVERARPVEDPAMAARHRAVERAELGDREALPQVIEVVGDDGLAAPLRASAARVLARLPEEGARVALERARGHADRRLSSWATVALASIGDAAAIAACREIAGEPELLARAALARAGAHDAGAVAALVQAVPATEDVELRRELLRALGASRDAAAAAAIVAAYEPVRTRKYAAFALGDLGDASTVPFLLEKLPAEPYTSVRAAIAHALGQIGDARARPALERLLAEEKEAQVLASAVWALARLGVARKVRTPATLAPPAGATEAWLVLADGASAPITIAGSALDTSVARDAYRVDARAPIKVTGPVTHVIWR
jgi:arylsulfatase A-like enzyme/HEAT repeat protein